MKEDIKKMSGKKKESKIIKDIEESVRIEITKNDYNYQVKNKVLQNGVGNIT